MNRRIDGPLGERPRITFALAAAALAVVASGCGASTYERRLEETAQYFAYLNHLDEQLARNSWRGGGVSIRLPKVFHEVPAPKDPAVANEDRYPEFIGPLHGAVAGAWTADVATDGRTEQCHLYILSNHDLYLVDESVETASDFQNAALAQLATAFGIPTADTTQQAKIEVPRSQPHYVPVREYHTLTLHPKEPVDGVESDVEIFMRTNGSIQSMFVLVVPKRIKSSERILDKLLLSLETLNLESKVPRRSNSGGEGKGDAKGGRQSGKPGF